MQVHITQPNGQQRVLEVAPGCSLMRAAVDAGVEGIIGECGGAAMCGTCHVFVDEADLARLPAMLQNEDELLEWTATPRQPNSRLGCQLKMNEAMAGIRLRLPEHQR